MNWTRENIARAAVMAVLALCLVAIVVLSQCSMGAV